MRRVQAVEGVDTEGGFFADPVDFENLQEALGQLYGLHIARPAHRLVVSGEFAVFRYHLDPRLDQLTTEVALVQAQEGHGVVDALDVVERYGEFQGLDVSQPVSIAITGVALQVLAHLGRYAQSFFKLLFPLG